MVTTVVSSGCIVNTIGEVPPPRLFKLFYLIQVVVAAATYCVRILFNGNYLSLTAHYEFSVCTQVCNKYI